MQVRTKGLRMHNSRDDHYSPSGWNIVNQRYLQYLLSYVPYSSLYCIIKHVHYYTSHVGSQNTSEDKNLQSNPGISLV